MNEDTLQRLVQGALKETINDHGPITVDYIPSATKRIVGQLTGWVLSNENDALCDSPPLLRAAIAKQRTRIRKLKYALDYRANGVPEDLKQLANR